MTEKQGNPLAEDGLPASCRDCTAYLGDVMRGVCRMHPPVPILTGMLRTVDGQTEPQFGAFWPHVSGDDFCFSFEPDRDKDLLPIPSPQPPSLADEKTAGEA